MAANLTLTEDYPFPDVPKGGYHITHGIKLNPGETPGIRYELRDLHQDPDLWNLYMLGMFQWHRVPQDHHYSWQKIGGIHGFPFKPWPPNDDSLNKIRRTTGAVGFCTHSSVLFLTWHRPYLALYEEVLHKIVQIVAEKYTEAEGRAKMIKKAKTFRIPFWDWARNDRPTFPDEAIASDKITVNMPAAMRKEHNLGDKADVEVHNPLFSYRWHPNTDPDFKINGKDTTVRYDAPDEADAENDGASTEEVKARLEKNMKPYDNGIINSDSGAVKVEGNLTERVIYLLQAYDRFYNFTSNSYKTPSYKDQEPPKQDSAAPVTVNGGAFGSLEDIHNTMHELAGGTGETATGSKYDGHMARVEMSAFDPIFWLHHANVDRLFAMWQGLHDQPGNKYAFVTPQLATNDWGGTWVTRPGEEENENTPLVPFYKSDGKFWDSTGVKYTRDLGYAYPETKEWTFRGNKTAYRKSIMAEIVKHYSKGSLATMITKKNVTGTHEDEDKLLERAKLWKAVQKSSEKSSALTMLQLAKGLGQTGIQGTGSVASAALNTVSQGLGAIGAAIPNTLTGNTANFGSQSLGAVANSLPTLKAPKEAEIHSHRSISALAADGSYEEWMVNIIAEKHSLGGRFQVHIFLGDVEEKNPHLFSISPNHVGTFSPLGQPEDTGCGKCQTDQANHEKVSGQIPLTIALVERYLAEDLKSLDNVDVVPYLQKNLHWEVVDHKGRRLEDGRNAVSSLQIAVASNEVEVAKSLDELPVYSADIRLWPSATTKVGGGGRGEGTGVTLSTLGAFLK